MSTTSEETVAAADPYPEHTKQSAIVDASQAIGQFLEGSGYILAEYRTFEELSEPRLTPVGRSINEVLAEYFEIDLAAIEREKRQMLDAMRQTNAR